MLGYSQGQAASSYVRLTVGVNAAVYVLSLALMFYARSLYLPMLEVFSVEAAPVWQAVGAGFVIIGLITAGNVVAIKRKVAALWYLEK